MHVMKKNIIIPITILLICQFFITPDMWAYEGGGSSFAPLELSFEGSGERLPEGTLPFPSYNDTDGNRIDDLIDHYIRVGSRERFDIFVNYDERIESRHLLELKTLDLYPAYVSSYINTLIIEGAPPSRFDSILGLEDVIGIENAPLFHPFLSTSVRAIRARASEEYSSAVWSELGLTGENVNIAIIDSGVDDTVHAGLRGKFIRGIDTTSPFGSVERNPDDGVGHGTHCAGIIMGTGSGGDNIGVAPNASLVDCKVGDTATLGSATAVNFMEGLEWVRDNAERFNISVLSISMGTEYSTDGTDAPASLANEVVDAGVTVVVAIGNDDNGHNANTVSSPGSADKVITVGAIHDKNSVTRNDDSIAGYSQQGPRPNDRDNDPMDELKPDLVAPGTDIESCMHNTLGSYIAFSGTSMATPHVSGVAALMKQAYPSLPPADIKDILRRSAEKKGASSLAQLDEKYNTLYGWGMMDAYGAVRRSKDLTTPELKIPAYVDGGSRISIRAEMELARTRYMEKDDLLKWVVSFPAYFDAPDTITVTTDPAIETTASWAPPYEADGNWRLEVEIGLAGSVSGISEVAPVLDFYTRAPYVGQPQQFDFNLNTSINDIYSPGRSYTLTVGGSADHKPDLTITSDDISFSSNPANTGEEITIFANVSNVGMSDAYAARVDFYDGNPQSGILIGSVEMDVPEMSIHQTEMIWVATSGSLHNIFVVIDPENEIDEVSENNNSAVKPIRVQGGINAPPVAALAADPLNADIDEEVSFSGSGSRDPDGTVTEWKFSFGDGNDSGWLPVDYTDHRYSAAGNYTASLIVKDNGGKESTNEETVRIAVRDLEGGNMAFFLSGDSNLTMTRPEGGTGNTKPCPNGFTPYPFPGSPVGRVEYKEIGTWSVDYPQETRKLVERVTLTFWIQNSAENSGFDVQFRASITGNGEMLLEGETEEFYMEPGSPPVELDLYSDISEIELKFRSMLTIVLEVKVNGAGLELVYEAQRHPSGFGVQYLPVENDEPSIVEVPDLRGKVDEDILLWVSAEDGDGEIVGYRWDTDNDLEWDTETVENHTTYVFEVPDEYRVNVMVLDDDGASDTGQFTVDIYAKTQSFPPTVVIEFPENGSIFSHTTVFRGSASDDNGIKTVSVRIDEEPWTMVSENGSWEVEVNVYRLEVGEHLFSVKATDDDGQESDIESVFFFVDTPRTPPTIKQWETIPREVNNSGRGLVEITIIAEDDDGPDDVESVSVDMTVLGLGKKECEMIVPGEFSLSVNIPVGTPPGTKTLAVEVRDRSDLVARTNITLVIIKMNLPPELEDETDDPRIRVGSDLTLTIAVSVSDPNGPDDISEVYLDLTPLGIHETIELNDEGVSGDDTEGDGIFTVQYTLPGEIEGGKKKFIVTAVDRGNEAATLEIEINFISPGISEPVDKDETVTYIIPISIVAGILLVLIMFLLARRKRKINSRAGKKD